MDVTLIDLVNSPARPRAGQGVDLLGPPRHRRANLAQLVDAAGRSGDVAG